MRRKDIKARYDAMMKTAPYQGYDGRGKGIDVYVCNKCGHKFFMGKNCRLQNETLAYQYRWQQYRHKSG